MDEKQAIFIPKMDVWGVLDLFLAIRASHHPNKRRIQCVRATFTLAVVVTVVNQKSPKSPVGGISPNL